MQYEVNRLMTSLVFLETREHLSFIHAGVVHLCHDDKKKTVINLASHIQTCFTAGYFQLYETKNHRTTFDFNRTKMYLNVFNIKRREEEHCFLAARAQLLDVKNN